MSKFKAGTDVYWTVGRGKNKRKLEGKITGFNPEIAPNTKYEITLSNGERLYPIVDVKRKKALAYA